eukprot:277139_1
MQSEPVVYTVAAKEEKETEDFDRTKLISYLNSNVSIESDWSKCAIYRCTSGYSNPPYIIYCGLNKYILRKKHEPWGIIKNHPGFFMNIKQQYKLISALYKFTNVPVPKMYTFCDDETVIGETFYIMQFIEGRVFTHIGPDLPTLPKEDRLKVYKEIVHILAVIHSIDIYKTGIYDIIKKQNRYTYKEIYNEWKDDYIKVYKDKKISKSILKLGPVIDKKYIEYKENNKDLQLNSLIHGDFHLENMIWDPVEYKIIAMVDWECCTIGNPIIELINCLRMYRVFPTQDIMRLDPPFEYHTGFRNIDLKQLGIPSENQQIMNYLYYANKVGISQSRINDIILWLQRKDNWIFGHAFFGWIMIAAFYQFFQQEDEDHRLQQAFGNERQYVVLDSSAVNALDVLQQESLQLHISSKL